MDASAKYTKHERFMSMSAGAGNGMSGVSGHEEHSSIFSPLSPKAWYPMTGRSPNHVAELRAQPNVRR
jgi:hypothetical protein